MKPPYAPICDGIRKEAIKRYKAKVYDEIKRESVRIDLHPIQSNDRAGAFLTSRSGRLA